MKRSGFALAILAIVATATWAYNVNYKTKQALGRVDELRRQIAAEREAVEVLRVEWAYLNAPDRLARLVAADNDRLGLVPLAPEHFGDVSAVPYPPYAPPPEPLDETPPGEGVPAAPAAEAGATLLAGFSAPMPPPRPAGGRTR